MGAFRVWHCKFFWGLRLIQALSVTFGSSIVYKIMPWRRKVLQQYSKSTPNPKSTSKVLQKYSKSTPKLPKKYSKSTPKVPQKYSKSAPKVLQKCPKSAPKVPQKYSKSAPKVLQKCPKSTPKVLHRVLHWFLNPGKMCPPPQRFFLCCAETICSRLLKLSDF